MGNIQIKLREYRPDDCKEVWDLFYNTIHSINAADYTPAQLDAWAPSNMDLHTWNQRLLRNDYAVVAELNGVIAGIGSADDTGYFDLLYVHKDYQKMGVATLIADDLEKYLYRKGAQTITTDASITAKPFFEKRGYIVQAKQSVECRGEYLTNYKMRKEVRG